MPKAILYVILGLSICLFAACLPQQGLSAPGWSGLGILLMGWIEPIAILDVGPFVAFAWYANPLLFLTWFFCMTSRNRAALFCGYAAMALSLSFLLGSRVLVSESGTPDEIVGCPIGYWLWVGSMLFALAGSFYARDIGLHELGKA